jgi:CHAD domain-containing protein
MKSRSPQMESKLKVEYCFRTGEELADAIGRILAEQLTRAVQVLSRPGDPLEGAVHEARRCLKRARSVLRLVKFAIPNTYRRENGRLREVGRSLSELRDSHALIQTLDDLEGHRKHRQPNGSRERAFQEAHTFLESRGQEIAKTMQEGGMKSSIAQLKTALTHIEKLSFAKVNAPGIAKSLYRSVKRGKKAFAAAKADAHPEKFHDLRKRAKDLRYQLSLFAELRPDLEQYSDSAKELEQLLGDDHNLAVLNDLLAEVQDPARELHVLREKISGRQSALREKATKIGGHLYRRKKVWKDRLAAIAAEP